MIHATFTGSIVGTTKFTPATAENEAFASFSAFVGAQHLPKSERDYMVCRLRGAQAEKLRHYLVPGKKVLCSGDVRLFTEVERPFFGCNVRTIELLGGGTHPLPEDVRANEHDDEEI